MMIAANGAEIFYRLDLSFGAQTMSCHSNNLKETEFQDQGNDCRRDTQDDNRRKEERFSVSDSVYVVVDTRPQTLGQVVEISSTGMAFTFVDIDAVSNRLVGQSNLRMDLFAGGKGFFAKGLAGRLVSKIESAPAPAFSSLSIKRVGVQFEDLTLPQQVQVNHIIRLQNRRSDS